MIISFILPPDFWNRSIQFAVSLAVVMALIYLSNFIIKSERIKKWITFKSYLMMVTLMLIGNLLGLASVLSQRQSKNQGWNANSESKVYSEVSASLDSLGFSEDNKKAISSCIMDKVKNKYPNGISQISDDQLQSEMLRIGNECTKSIDNVSLIGWTPTFELQMRKYFSSQKELDLLSDSKKKVYVDCIIEKLKIRYPDGINEKLPQSEAQQIGTECAEEIIK